MATENPFPGMRVWEPSGKYRFVEDLGDGVYRRIFSCATSEQMEEFFKKWIDGRAHKPKKPGTYFAIVVDTMFQIE